MRPAKTAAFLIALILGASAQTGTPRTNQDRECACNLENLWLDVVVVVDNSIGMSNGLVQAAADIATVFDQSTIGSGYADPRSTRVGLVTYAATAQQQADLNKYTSVDSMIDGVFNDIKPSTSEDSIVKAGLSSALDLLLAGRANNVRGNYKQVVIVYASEYKADGPNDPNPEADRIKSSGISIITVAFDQGGGQALLDGLKKIASPDFAFNSTDANVVGEVQGALCQVNCFCPNEWAQYTAVFESPSLNKYGVCLKVANIDAAWTVSKIACQNLYQDAYLVTEFDQQKHDFNQKLFMADNTTAEPYMFHIGLSYDTASSAYLWEQKASMQRLPVRGQSYVGWSAGYPSLTSTTPCVINQQAGSLPQMGWQNENCYQVAKRYLCEVSSCDTDKYCTF